MKDFALNEVKEKLPIAVSAIVETFEDEISLKWIDDNEADQIKQDIIDVCDDFYYTFQDLPYEIMKEYRDNFTKCGRDVAERYSKQVEWLFKDNLSTLNEAITLFDNSFPGDIMKLTADVRDFEFLLPDIKNRYSLRFQAIQINGIYAYLKSNLGLADIRIDKSLIDSAILKQPDEVMTQQAKPATWRQMAIAQYFREKSGADPMTPKQKRDIHKNFELAYNKVTKPGTDKKRFRALDVQAALILLEDDPNAQRAAKQYLDEL